MGNENSQPEQSERAGWEMYQSRRRDLSGGTPPAKPASVSRDDAPRYPEFSASTKNPGYGGPAPVTPGYSAPAGQPVMGYPMQPTAPPAGGAMAMVPSGVPTMGAPGQLPIVTDGPVLSPSFVFNYPYRWLIQDDLFTAGSRAATIKDASGRDILKGAGKFFSFHDDTTFYDMAGNKVCRILNRVLSIGSIYKIYTAQNQTVMVQRRDVFNWPGTSTSRVYRGNPHFNILGKPDVPTAYPEIYHVTGLVPGNSFNIKNQVTQCVVATANRSLFFNGPENTYVLECAPGVDALLMLMITIIIAHETAKANRSLIPCH